MLRHRLDAVGELPPVGLVGYPWSKLVAEQGLPVRLARAGCPSRSCACKPEGIARLHRLHSRSTDIKVRIATAVLDTGLQRRPGSRRCGPSRVDTVKARPSSVLFASRLAPCRHAILYHLVNPRPSTHGLRAGDFGLPVREVSYQGAFKRACHARGPRADAARALAADRSLRGPVVPGSRCGGASYGRCPGGHKDRPVGGGLRHRADLGTAEPHWPGLITATARSLSWIGRHPGEWPYSRPAVSLDRRVSAAPPGAGVSWPGWMSGSTTRTRRSCLTGSISWSRRCGHQQRGSATTGTRRSASTWAGSCGTGPP